MIDPCTLPETGWGWLALVTVSLTLLGLGVAFVALPRRSWMALVGAAAMAVVGIGGATSVDAQTDEECYSIRIVNMGTAGNPVVDLELVNNWEKVTVCEWRMVAAGFPVESTDNCVSFDVGAAIGDVKWLELSGPSAMVSATAGGLSQSPEYTTGIGLWSAEPTMEQIYEMADSVAFDWSCNNDTSTGTFPVADGDTVWVATNSLC